MITNKKAVNIGILLGKYLMVIYVYLCVAYNLIDWVNIGWGPSNSMLLPFAWLALRTISTALTQAGPLL